MDQERKSWQPKRTISECAVILRSLDARTIQRRAERLSAEIPILPSIGFEIPHRTDQLFDEAGRCFTNGMYNGCVLVLATGVEHGLRELLKASKRSHLYTLIEDGVKTGFISVAESHVLKELTDYRNQAVHSDIARLASGLKLSRQDARLQPCGVETSSDWEEFEPESQSDMEIAVDLREENRVGELFAKVREVVYDIFDRYSASRRSQEQPT